MEINDGVTDDNLLVALRDSSNLFLSLYIHIPFCHQLCYYCGCNKIVTRNKDKAVRYLEYLKKEITERAKFADSKTLKQVHLGGGTPNFLSSEQLHDLFDFIRSHFVIESTLDLSIELDPRVLSLDSLSEMKRAGVTRISFGIQDFDSQVQKAINREQSFGHIESIMERAKALNFNSINFDLVYGLPHQNQSTVKNTLEKVIQLTPDRLSIFNYAHMPQRFAAQRKIKEQWLPSAEEKSNMLCLMQQTLTEANYTQIGMDHFAKSNDSLSQALVEGKLHRNFQGYTEFGDIDLLGLGVTSISQVGNVLAQNHKTLNDYYSAIDSKQSVINKGKVLSDDDLVRAEVIKQLICIYRCDIQEIEAKFHIDFNLYFSEEMSLLSPMIQDGLVTRSNTEILIANCAQPLVRTICMTFDKYLPKYQRTPSFSKVI